MPASRRARARALIDHAAELERVERIVERVGRRVRGIVVARDLRRRARALLDHVRQLVREQAAAGLGLRRVAAGRERDVGSDGVRVGRERARRLAGALVGVHAHRCEVAVEARLEMARAGNSAFTVRDSTWRT